MVRASVRFLLFTRTAAIIEIWVEHDTEPNPRKTTNTSPCPWSAFFCLRTLLLLPCLPGPYGRSTEINLKDSSSFLPRMR